MIMAKERHVARKLLKRLHLQFCQFLGHPYVFVK